MDVLEDKGYNNTRVIYGGSVKADNVNQFTNLQNIEGALVGGASLKASEFIELIKEIW